MDLGSGSVHSLLDRMDRGLLRDVRPALHGHTAVARRMRLTTVLRGHSGCVNRLALSDDARLLLSGSDDCTLRLWSVDSHTSVSARAVVHTDHFANIFAVAFMPDTANAFAVSGGLDHQVIHSNVETSKGTLWTCHSKTVRTVAPLSAHTFISASRDGTARLIDTRVAPTVDPPVVVRLANRLRKPVPLSCAVPSPTNDNHLLVAAMEYPLRVVDFRSTQHDATEDGPRGATVETYCPPHLQAMAPEQCMIAAGLRRVIPTYANFSPDGSQIVASYFDDAVVVFDRDAAANAPRLCRAPAMSAARRREAFWHFCNESAQYSWSHTARALGAANRALELEPGNLLVLLIRTRLLMNRDGAGDFRTAYGCLQQVIDTIDEDGREIRQLWGRDTPHAPLTFSSDWDSWRDRAEIWRVICQFYQALSLYRMIPPLYENLLFNRLLSEREHTHRRLQFLDALCTRLEAYRDATRGACGSTPGGWRARARARALGPQRECETLYATRPARYRVKVLSALLDAFLTGIDHLRSCLRESMAHLRAEDEAHTCRSDLRRVHELLEAAEEGYTVDTKTDDADDTGGGGGGGGSGSSDGSPSRGRKRGSETLDGDGDGDGDDGATAAAAAAAAVAATDVHELWGSLKLGGGSRCFHGHTSRHTDIKEANFFGSANQVVMSGSDDAHVYLWSATTGELLSQIEADDQIVNCVLAHPTHSMIIASGIDDTIKVLTPGLPHQERRPDEKARKKEDGE